LFLPFGFEFTHHFGKELDWVWGIRVTGSFSPWGRRKRLGNCNDYEYDDPNDDGWSWFGSSDDVLCSYSYDFASTFMAGIGFFIGY
jgi:hypothetical protein